MGRKCTLRSARDRLLERLRALGVPAQPIEVQGDVMFTNYFFDPRASFHAMLKYPTSSAQLDLDISSGMTVWQIDAINLPWTQAESAAAAAAQAPVVVASPTPTPTPAPQQKSRRKRNR